MPDWYCPQCAGRLSYGVYCKICKAEFTFAIRPASEAEIEAAAAAQVIAEARQRQAGELEAAYALLEVYGNEG